MVTIRDLKIDIASLGDKKLLVDVLPAYEYVGGKRTDTVLGYRYVVCLAAHQLRKLSVRIDGNQILPKPDGYMGVEFSGLEITAYEMQGKVQLCARAVDVYPVS